MYGHKLKPGWSVQDKHCGTVIVDEYNAIRARIMNDCRVHRHDIDDTKTFPTEAHAVYDALKRLDAIREEG